MIVTLTDADVKSIVEFYAEFGLKSGECVPVAPALMARMSDEQRDMAATIMIESGRRALAHADEVERFAAEHAKAAKG
jgi:hypothetical protein